MAPQFPKADGYGCIKHGNYKYYLFDETSIEVMGMADQLGFRALD